MTPLNKIVVEHAALFKGMLGDREPDAYERALGVVDQTIIKLIKSDLTPELNRHVFMCLGGTIIHRPINKQDQSSPLVEVWEWIGGGIPYYRDFLHHPLALTNWLERFSDIQWRLERTANSYGVKIYRTIHTHSDPTVALAIACVHYSKRLIEIIREDEKEPVGE
jgi:hypothetical protein